MASSLTGFTICLLLLTIFSTVATSDEYSGILSRLYKKAVQQNRPLILVLDNVNAQYKADAKPKVAAESQHHHHHHNEDNPFLFRYQLEQQAKNKQVPLKRLPKSEKSSKMLGEPKPRLQAQQQLHEAREILDKQSDTSKGLLRSRAVKRLLRSLTCEAKDECEDECDGHYSGKQKQKCKVVCEVKFECEPEEEEQEEGEDPCKENGDCELSDECGDDDECSMSTKGERLVTETPKCKRC